MKNNHEERMIDWSLYLLDYAHIWYFLLVGSSGFAFSSVHSCVAEAEIQASPCKKWYIVFRKKVQFSHYLLCEAYVQWRSNDKKDFCIIGLRHEKVRNVNFPAENLVPTALCIFWTRT